MPQVAEQLAGNAGGPSTLNGLTRFSPLVGSLGGSLFVLEATEADAEQAIHSTITLRNLYVRVVANDLASGTSIIRTRVNGANGNLSVSIGAGATGEFEDLVNSDSLVDGDDANYQDVIQTTSGGERLDFTIFGVNFEHATDMTSYDVNDRRNNMTRGDPPDYRSIIGGISGAPTETTLQRRVRFVSTISDFNVRVDANATANGATCTYRVNAAAGNQTVSIGGGATGNFEDGINTDVLASGDLVDYEEAPAAGGMPDDISFEKIQTRMVDTTTNGYLLDASSFPSTPFGETNFVTVEGQGQDSGSTEANAQLLLRSDNDAEDLYVRVTSNSLDDATLVRVRLDGANGNLNVSIGAAATGEFEDNTNQDDLDTGVDVNYELDTSASTVGSIISRIFGIEALGVGVTAFAFALTERILREADPTRNVDYRRGIVTSITIEDAISRVRGVSFALIQDLSAIQSVLIRQVDYTRPLVADLSALRDAALRNVGYLRGIVTSITISDAVARVKGISFALIQDLSAIGTVFQRQVNYRRSLRNFLLIEDVSRRVSTYFRGLNVAIVISAVSSFILPITQFIFNLRAAIVVSARVVRQVSYRRTFRDSVIVRDILSAVLPVAAPARSFLFYVGIKLRGRLLRR